MIIHLLSDLHLERGALPHRFGAKALGADLRLLAGDIGEGIQGVSWALGAFATPTAYVFGNHEHHSPGPMARTMSRAARLCEGSALSVLELGEIFPIPGARVLGATLWTGFDLFHDAKRDQAALELVEAGVGDFRLMGHGESGAPRTSPRSDLSRDTRDREPGRLTLSARSSVDLHRATLAWLESRLATPFVGKTIVLTHHAPHPLSLLYQQGVELVDAAYASNLERLLVSYPIDLWAHGHTHVPCDYTVGATRVVSNPRGYFPSALVDGFDPDLTIEI